MSRGTTGQGGVGGGVRTGAGSVNNGKIGCGVAGAPIASDDVVAVLRLWNAGRNVVEKKCIIISMSMNALVFLKKKMSGVDWNTKKTGKKILPDGRWNAFESDEDEGEELGLVCSISDFARARQGVGMPVVQSTRPTVMIMVATMATTTVGKGGKR